MRKRRERSTTAGDLSVAALDTAAASAAAGFPETDVFARTEARDVYGATNAALGLARAMRRRQPFPSLSASLVQRHAMIDHLAGASGADTFEPAAVARAGGLPHADEHTQALIWRCRPERSRHE